MPGRLSWPLLVRLYDRRDKDIVTEGFICKGQLTKVGVSPYKWNTRHLDIL